MSTAPKTVFGDPPNAQQNSPLGRLPTELRLEVLGLLLKHNGPIFTSRSQNSRGIVYPLQRERISPQILRTCKDFYIEGYNVLYSENIATVSFQWTSPFPRTYSLKVLDASACFMNPVPPKVSISFLVAREPYTQCQYIDLGTRTLVEALDTLERFAKIHIIFIDTVDYAIVSRYLRRCIHNKTVTVDLGPLTIHLVLTNNVGDTFSLFSPGEFGIWKCKSIKFQRGCRRGCCNRKYLELTRLITNHQIKVQDLPNEMRRLDRALSVLRVLSLDLYPYASCYNQVELASAVCNNDVPAFKQARHLFMEQVIRTVKRWYHSKREEIIHSTLVDGTMVNGTYEAHDHGDDEEDPQRDIWTDSMLQDRDCQITDLGHRVSDTGKLMIALLAEDDLTTPVDTQDTNTQTPAGAE